MKLLFKKIIFLKKKKVNTFSFLINNIKSILEIKEKEKKLLESSKNQNYKKGKENQKPSFLFNKLK